MSFSTKPDWNIYEFSLAALYFHILHIRKFLLSVEQLIKTTFWGLVNFISYTFQILNVCRDLMNEGIFDIVTDVLQSDDKKFVLTGY